MDSCEAVVAGAVQRTAGLGLDLAGADDNAADLAVGNRILDGDGLAQAAFVHGAAAGSENHARGFEQVLE